MNESAAMQRVGIVTVGTARPEPIWPQETLRRMYHEVGTESLRPAAVRLIDRVFRQEAGIEQRALACQDPRVLIRESPEQARERFEAAAPRLASDALAQALERAAIDPAAIGALVCCTCTGYLCPGISSYVHERLGLESSTRCYDLVGMGCGASLPALDLACHLAPELAPRIAAVVAVEVCSATAVFGEDPDLIVSNALFADGAAAALVSNRSPRIRFLEFVSEIQPRHRERLRLVYQGTRLRNRLDKSVPHLAASAAQAAVHRLLARHALEPHHVRHWLVHPGGTRILEQIAEVFALTPERLIWSYEVLRECGNMSSPTSLFVVDRFLASNPVTGLGVLLAFGAGFSCHAALFQVDDRT